MICRYARIVFKIPILGVSSNFSQYERAGKNYLVAVVSQRSGLWATGARSGVFSAGELDNSETMTIRDRLDITTCWD